MSEIKTPLTAHVKPASRMRPKVVSPVIKQLGDCAVLLARRGGSDTRRAAGCARVGNGGWNEGDEDNADDSEPVMQAESGDVECDEGDEDKHHREAEA